jgi:hypothetical protein
VSDDLLRTVYIALAESVLSYALLSWGNATAHHINVLARLQNSIIKIICPGRNISSTRNARDIYKICCLLPVKDLYKYSLVLKYYFDSQYKVKYIHSMGTRSISLGKLAVPNVTNKHGARCLELVVPQLFNSLPNDIKSFDKISLVKSNIKTYYLNNLPLCLS